MNSPVDTDEDFVETLELRMLNDIVALRDRVVACNDWDLVSYVQQTRIYEELTEEVEQMFETADSYGYRIAQADLDALDEALEATTLTLLQAAHHPCVREETLTTERAFHRAGSSTDDLVTIGLKAAPGKFATPTSHGLILLITQFAGAHFDAVHRIVTVPRWVRDQIERFDAFMRVWIADECTHPVPPSGDVLDAANTLWDPQGNGSYRSVDDAIRAAELLVKG